MEKYFYHYTIFGQVSDPNAYGGGSYDSAEYGDVAATGTEQPVPTEGELANTGFDIFLPIALGVTMVVGSVIALAKMRSSKKQS